MTRTNSVTPRWRMLWRVAVRDLLATIRDRRTLNATIFMPLIMIPLFTLGMPLLMGKLIGGQQQDRQKIGVIGTLPANLRAALERDEKGPDGKVMRAGLDLVPVTDARKAVEDGDVEAVLHAPAALPNVAGAGTGVLEVYAKLSSMRAQTGAFGKVEDIVDGYNRSLALDRMKTAGLPETTLSTVTLKPIDTSTEQAKRSGQLAFLIPMLMLSVILSGGMATAVDATAGEKERGTLESLLISPVNRSEVVGGKLLATTITALASAVFSVLGFLLSGVIGAIIIQRNGMGGEITQMMGGQLSLTPATGLTLLGVALSSALVISAALVAIGIYARSFKEAQTYMAPLNMAIIIPAVMLQFADFLSGGSAIYATPIIGGMLALLDTVRGTITASHALMAIGANVLAAVIVAVIARRSFGREEVIFRN